MSEINMKNKVAIIDYHLGNLFSVQQACNYLEMDSIITSDGKEILDADFVILPGVGAFGDAMQNLFRLDLVEPIKDYIACGKPFMGVCLGLQLLFTESEEFGYNKGLNIIEGSVVKFPTTDKFGGKLKVPQIEWNQIFQASQEWTQTPLSTCINGDYMYFVHSYYVRPSNETAILTNTSYGGYDYCSSILAENVFATQFHPEKSSLNGVSIYNNWFKKQ